MAKDYPDWTDLVQIIGADIMVPIDIQGAYIMMPVDIQAQYLTLEIDIVAASVEKVKVDLVAQTVGAIEIDIKAASIGTLNIDIEAQSVGVFMQPDWNVKEGNAKAWALTGSIREPGEYLEQTYEVPAGKTLYITDSSCLSYTTNAEHADKPQVIEMNQTGYYLGGNGGCHLQQMTPLKITAGLSMTFRITNRAAHNTYICGSVRGWEI